MTEQEAIKKAEELNRSAIKKTCPLASDEFPMCKGVECAWFIKATTYSHEGQWYVGRMGYCAIVGIAKLDMP